MNKNLFFQSILVSLFLFQFLSISANRYGASCASDSDCDQHQRCEGFICHCNTAERRFWTGEICAICVAGFTVTFERCYQAISESKTWSEARSYCRTRYADLFTWRNNDDEQFIRPVVQSLPILLIMQSTQLTNMNSRQYILWAGATIPSLNPYTIKWMDPNGMQLTSSSEQWCDPTVHNGYTSQKEPTSTTRRTTNSTEREECVTYIIGAPGTNLLCLADDYCSQAYPFICEMNAASMKLANSVIHGSDDDIDFEEEAATPIPSSFNPDTSNLDAMSSSGLGPNSPSALTENNSSTTIFIVIFVVVTLIIGAIVGYIVIKKRKKGTDDTLSGDVAASEGRPSYTSSVKSMVE